MFLKASLCFPSAVWHAIKTKRQAFTYLLFSNSLFFYLYVCPGWLSSCAAPRPADRACSTRPSPAAPRPPIRWEITGSVHLYSNAHVNRTGNRCNNRFYAPAKVYRTNNRFCTALLTSLLGHFLQTLDSPRLSLETALAGSRADSVMLHITSLQRKDSHNSSFLIN